MPGSASIDQVTAIFELGMSEFDASVIFMPFAEAQLYFNMEGRAQTIEGAAVGKRTKKRHRASPVRDLDGLPALDLPEQLARALP